MYSSLIKQKEHRTHHFGIILEIVESKSIGFPEPWL